jgi:hypothetical protein
MIERDLNQEQQDMEYVIRHLGKKWSSGLVARSAIEDFTGGLYTATTMANFDSKKEGPHGAFKIGRAVVYPTVALCDWLISRASLCDR